jgi:hypothetical protein
MTNGDYIVTKVLLEGIDYQVQYWVDVEDGYNIQNDQTEGDDEYYTAGV